ncbi:hypothetical protein [Citrobacter koseri]|uniref:hypothetical protein n=1 Tax=Citrobacter koseri TaxID=545 RepID=UPI003BF77A87
MEKLIVSVTDLLVEGGAFDISGIVLCYDDRVVKFMPVFLYGQDRVLMKAPFLA